MIERLQHVKRYVALSAVLAGLFLMPAPTPAEPKPAKQDPLVARMVCEYLKRGHLNRPAIDDELSRRLFRRFLKDLDPAKLYFLKSDIDEFKKFETELDDQLLEGDLKFAYQVHERFVSRVAERQKLIQELVNAPHDFTVKEYLDTDYDNLPYAGSADELRERWRTRIKYDLLQHKIGEKPLPDDEAKKKVLARYDSALKRWKQFDGSDLLELYLTALTTSVDPHSTYMSPITLDDFEIAMRLNLDGIGALLRSEEGTTTISEIVPGGAAAKDGHLKPKDKIIAVAQGDGKFVDAVDMKLQDVVKMIRGPRGTKVQLKVIPVGKVEPYVLELTRQKIELKSQEARGDVVEQGKKPNGKPYLIGVIDLPSFYAEMGTGRGKADAKSATEDVRKILKEFEEKNVDGVVLDLRRNGGGSLYEARALTGLFIDKGPVVQVRSGAVRSGTNPVRQLDDPERGVVYGGPLIVLTSRFSASASEILAGALQDYGRALIVGDSTTYGKGTVQTVIDLGGQIDAGDTPPKLGALKLTIQQFYRVNGDSTQEHGVASDVVLPSLTEALAGGEKEQEFALSFDKVEAVKHEHLDHVPADVKAVVQERSAKRVKESADFNKLVKDVELFNERKARKKVPLNEQELRDQSKKDDADKIDQKVKELTPDDPPSSETAFKFKRNFINNEVLQIMEDYLQGKKLVAGR
jgi:carboxyl-terminal processing protease